MQFVTLEQLQVLKTWHYLTRTVKEGIWRLFITFIKIKTYIGICLKFPSQAPSQCSWKLFIKKSLSHLSYKISFSCYIKINARIFQNFIKNTHNCTCSPMKKKLTYFLFTAQHILTKPFCYIVTIYLSHFSSIKTNRIQAIV